MKAYTAWREFDLGALRHNYGEIRRLVGLDIKIIASVKANAYGHGVVEVARALQKLDVYSVATSSFEDAVTLRDAGIDCRIQVFPGIAPSAIPELLALGIIPSIGDFETAHAISKAARSPTNVYVKVDCGLGRLGVRVEEAETFVTKVGSLPHIVIEGIFTHLPFNDLQGRDWAIRRVAVFESLIRALERDGIRIPITQARATTAIATGIKDSCTAVCVGHLLYGGLNRLKPELADTSHFRPVLKSIRTCLIHTSRLPAAESGGGPYHNMPLGITATGVLPFGLYHGYRNALVPQAATMLYRGRPVKVLGVNLEYTILDLTGFTDPKVGDEVIVLGEANGNRVSLEDMATWQGSSPLHLLMNMDQRMPSVYVDSSVSTASTPTFCPLFPGS